MASTTRFTPRGVLVWGAVIITLLFGVALATTVLARATSVTRGVFGPPAPPTITQQVVVEQLQSVAKLVATEMTLRDVVVYEQTRFASTKRALIVVTGRVAAGIDLEHGTDVRIDSATRVITVTLPPAQVMSVDVLNVKTYDESSGWLNPFRPEDRDRIQQMVRAQLTTAARESGILTHADQSAVKVLTELLGRDGYRVEVVRPVVEHRPTGYPIGVRPVRGQTHGSAPLGSAPFGHRSPIRPRSELFHLGDGLERHADLAGQHPRFLRRARHVAECRVEPGRAQLDEIETEVAEGEAGALELTAERLALPRDVLERDTGAPEQGELAQRVVR